MNRVDALVHERLAGYPACDDIVEALNGSRYEILPSKTLAAPIWSPLFNAYSEACASLNFTPGERLVDQPVDVPPESEWLGGALLRLVNETAGRNKPARYQFFSRGKSLRRVCPEAEPRFVESLGIGSRYGITAGKRKNVIFIDDDSEPIFFKKVKEVGSSLSLKEVGVNGVTHPPGTIMDVGLKNEADFPLAESREAVIRNIDDIGRVSPLRLSMMAVPRPQRLDAILVTGDASQHPDSTINRESRVQAALPTVPEIVDYLETKIPGILQRGQLDEEFYL